LTEIFIGDGRIKSYKNIKLPSGKVKELEKYKSCAVINMALPL